MYLLCAEQTQDALQTITENIRTETYPVSGHVGCGVSVEILSGAPGAVAAPRPKQVLSELNPMILTTVRALSIGLSGMIQQRTACDYCTYGVPGY